MINTLLAQLRVKNKNIDNLFSFIRKYFRKVFSKPSLASQNCRKIWIDLPVELVIYMYNDVLIQFSIFFFMSSSCVLVFLDCPCLIAPSELSIVY